MNNTLSFGADVSGDAWRRKLDCLGSAFVNSGLSQDHREYLSLGGIGFMLGDGALKYARESVSETYYTAHVTGGLYLAALLSFVNNSGAPFAPERTVSTSLIAGALGRAATFSGGCWAGGIAWATGEWAGEDESPENEEWGPLGGSSLSKRLHGKRVYHRGGAR